MSDTVTDECKEIAKTLTKGKAKKSFGPSATHQQALQFGCRGKGFHVGVRHRDDKVRNIAVRLCKLGLFSYHHAKRYGDGTTYRTTDKGREVLQIMNDSKGFHEQR